MKIIAIHSIGTRWLRVAIAAWLGLTSLGFRSEAADPVLKISARPLHGSLNEARINPMLFGNFVELLDDLCPGMWAEMLNDRGFEGVEPPAKWVYYDGSPTFCDRQWDRGSDWTIGTAGSFNGPRCARLMGRDDRPVGLTQSGLAIKRHASYRFSGWLRGDAEQLRVQVILKASLPDGHFDELAIAELPAPWASWTRCSADLKAAGASDRVVFELRVIGKGTVWVDKLSLMPADNLSGWRPDVVEAIRASHPAVIRWGGSAVDPGGYRWKNGIGSRDLRAPFANHNWGRIDSNDVGIDEFCQFCALAGAAPLVCVSFSDGSASAADLVQYCNGSAQTRWGARRAANGHVAPYAVKYWQLGNEINGDDEAYIKKCREFIRAMKESDPTIAILSSFPSQKVLDALGKDLAYVAPHHYTRDLRACEADFQKLSSMFVRTPGCSHLRIAVTEWNFTAGDWGLLRAKMLTLEGAILNARYLNLLCRYSNVVEIGCRSNMTNSFCSGIIGTNAAGLLKRPSYHVMKLYADYALPIPLRVADTPTGVDAIACADEQRRKVSVFAINPTSEPVGLTLDLSDFGPAFHPSSIETVCDTRDMRQPDVMNQWTAPDRVQTVIQKVSGTKISLPALSVSSIACGPR
jgi:alpha-N-arabinofuranosidase